MIPNDDILVVEVNSCFTVTVGNGAVPCQVSFGEWFDLKIEAVELNLRIKWCFFMVWLQKCQTLAA